MAATSGPWRQGQPPYESPNAIYGRDPIGGGKQIVAEVFGYSHEQIQANVEAILAASPNPERAP